MKETKGTFSLKDFKLIKKIIINALNPDAVNELTDAERTELKALYHRLGRNDS